MLDDDVRALLEGPNIAHIATLMRDGSPHSTPVWVGLEGEFVAIFTGPATLKARNLDRDGRVALSITKIDDWKQMATVRGVVRERVEGDRAWAIIDRMSHTYEGGPYPREETFVVYLIEPVRASAMAY
jgi:PPOX class probable F420-dependent enzyme